eukprot:CAMPEP_0197312438 /NCGR_PEP_ID=MMETSP0891-20130614/21064_1 /TAXON_ID=44058 ORGANISM="Aureoumbra lagunensis, Strain CCMP1510" /NCGR_SAMPLE_ID=MMETSP0891 /ASSEMBLY_ACC=CAM_ASM_000534 /LENGTH=58 /DNA_ID=CAMNT_0042799601 /DNA_START=595 /DNA_END=771 /DNA_ORIENTATION=-
MKKKKKEMDDAIDADKGISDEAMSSTTTTTNVQIMKLRTTTCSSFQLCLYQSLSIVIG